MEAQDQLALGYWGLRSSPPAQLSRGSQNIIDLIFTGAGRSCAALQAWEIITSVSLQLVIEIDVRYKQ